MRIPSEPLPLLADGADGAARPASDPTGPPTPDDLALRGPSPPVRTLVDEFLAEQAATTAVERFSRAHDDGAHESPACGDAVAADRPRRYRDLMPATPPGPGQQYAFEVDLDACSGCKACVAACSSLNGLPEGVSFRDTGTLVGEHDGDPIRRDVTAACHHCVEPGCLEGCPSKAYEKDPDTGAVRHLDDQCIGCQYCTLMCPYEVPRYDADRGIVRKCDLCHDRLAEGESPACVQACPTEAITVRVVDLEEAVRDAGEDWPFPAPDPSVTVPTTRYRTSEQLDATRATDHDALRPAHAHPPLTVMLVLTQLAVGAVVALAATALLPADGVTPLAAGPTAVTALAAAALALGASVLHLGRPAQAWRAVLGLRRSWLSREVVAFGAFAVAAAAFAGAMLDIAPLAAHPTATAAAAVGTGAAGVYASAMVYAATGRRWWSLPRVLGRFAATTALLGTATLLAVRAVVAAAAGIETPAVAGVLAVTLSAVALVVVAVDLALLRHRRRLDDPLGRTARLLVAHHGRLLVGRLALLVAGAVGAPWLAVMMLTAPPTSATAAAVCATAGLLCLVGAELLERWRFFTAVAPRRMPGRLP